MSSEVLQRAYDEYYFGHYAGRPYERDPHWLDFFAAVAERIVGDIDPRVVLDAGCAMGFLVEALRERGVEAVGVDISPFALSCVAEQVQAHCWLGSLTNALPGTYDLIVCIEVLEHLTPDDARAAIANFCRASDDILISSTPFEYKDATHENVQPPEYWAALFARHGFFRDVDYDATYVAPWAARFRRTREPTDRLVATYERRLWQLEKENRARRELTLEQRNALAQRELAQRALSEELADQRRTVTALSSQITDRQQVITLLNSQLYEQQLQIDKMGARDRAHDGALRELRGELEAARDANAAAQIQLRAAQAELAGERERSASTATDLAGARQAVARGDAEIAALRLGVARLDAAVAREARARENGFDTLKRRLVEKDEAIQLLAGRLADAEQAARLQDAHWDLITQSRGWAALQRFWRLRDRLPRRRARPGPALASPVVQNYDPPLAPLPEDLLDAELRDVVSAPPADAAAEQPSDTWSERSSYVVPEGVTELRGEGRPLLTTPEGGRVAIDDALLALWRCARDRSLASVLARSVNAATSEDSVRAGLVCLAEAGLLARGAPRAPTPPASIVKGPLVSAVIVAYQGKDWLAQCLPSLFAQSWAALEVIVVDNGSRDGTVEWLATTFPRVRLLHLERAGSLAAALNRGVALARGDHFLVLNQDVHLAPDALAEMMAAARGRTGCAAVVPKLRFWWAPSFLNGIGNFVEDASWGSDNGIGHLDLGQFDQTRSLASGCFAALLIPRAAWQKVGPADERFALYYEDVEWCYRARLLGDTIQAAPRAQVYHAFGGRVPTGRPSPLAARKLRHVVAGRLRFATKLVPRGGLRRFLRNYGREDRANLRAALRAGDLANARAYLRGWLRWLGQLPALAVARRQLQERASGLGKDLFAFEPAPQRPRLWNGLPELTWDGVVEHYLPLLREGRTRPMPEFAAHERPTRLLIVSQDVVDRKLAGPGMRYLEMARALAADVDVTLAVPAQSTLESPPVKIVRYFEDRPGSLHLLVENSDVAVVSGYMARKFAFLEQTQTRLVVDLYDPLVLENLHYHLDQPLRAQLESNHEAVDLTNRLARIGDFFICGNGRQRDFWLGTLAANQRINPHTFAQDPTLDALIDVVGIGFPEHPPQARQPVLRGVHEAFPAAARIVLWGGGIWDWLDPLTLVRAWPQVVARHPEARLVFLGTRHPNPLVPRHKMAQQTEQLAEESGERERTIFFREWLPYEERETLLCEADVGVALHPLHVETRYSVRTRVLDYFWARLPVIVSAGDVTSEWVQAHGVGRVVAPGDADAVARATIDILDQPRHALDAAFAPLHERMTWRQVVGPLRRYCREGGRAPDRSRSNGHCH